MKTLAVVIPAHNEAYTIGGIIKDCLKYTPTVIVVDDGSRDTTALISRYCGAEVYCHPKNYGYGATIRTGLAIAKEFDYVVTIDADLQHNPDEIPHLINKIEQGYDVVIGSRFYKHNGLKIPKYRRFGVWLITETYNFGHEPITDAQSGFRAFSKRFVNSVKLEENGFGSTIEILVKARKQGFKITEVPISCTYHNLEQDSHLNPFKHGFDVIMKTIEWRIREWN